MEKKFYPVILIGLILAAGLTVQNSEKKEAQRRREFEQKIAVLEERISELSIAIGAVGEEQAKTDLALTELQNRQVVRQKSQDELLTVAVAKVSPAVVSIVVSKDVAELEVIYVNPFGNDPFFKNFDIKVPVYRQKGVQKQKVGAGTGFLIRKDGYILTNKHVVADEAATYMALLADGSQKPAEVVYRDSIYDIAIVKIEGEGLAITTFGNSDSLKLGQTVAAIGNALGEYNNSVSVGIISGLHRTIEASGLKLENVIQTDAAINPGNSGGPLLDLSSQVVGMNVATVIGSNSISFSIPINLVKQIIKDVLGG